MDEDTLHLTILRSNKESQRVIFAAWTDKHPQHKLGVASCDTERYPMWQLDMPTWPEMSETLFNALKTPKFQDFFSLLFMQFYEFRIGVLYIYDDCGAVSFSVKPN